MRYNVGSEIHYYDKNYRVHVAEIIEINGSLIFVREKGVEKYIYDFMVIESKNWS